MAFIGRTPESLIPRSDSRNPATTCKGITKSGRPCRRPIDAKANNDEGVLAIVPVTSDSDSDNIGAAAYFCWQHKDQAEQLAAIKSNDPDTQLYPLKEQNSIDTLVQRLGVLEVESSVRMPVRTKTGAKNHADQVHEAQPPRRINRPETWDRVEGPLLSVPSDLMAKHKKRRDIRPSKPNKQRKHPSFWASLCCGAVDADADADAVEAVRRKKQTSDRVKNSVVAQTQLQPLQRLPKRRHTQSRQESETSTSGPTTSSSQMSKDLPASKPVDTNLDTAKMLSFIPQNVSPQLASTLLAELSKPISPHDDEGYIYIFWLTPEASGPGPSSTASTLLAAPSQLTETRLTSELLRQYSIKQDLRSQTDGLRQMRGKHDRARSGETEKRNILLKIGRANNVHRRMHEWTRQCGYSLSLVRFYPYISSATPMPSPQASPANSRQSSAQNIGQSRRASDAGTVRKVPTVMRVERMIHLELAEQRVMKKCDACGKQHQEWFEVEASRDGVSKVDEVIKRWVKWAEQTKQTSSL